MAVGFAPVHRLRDLTGRQAIVAAAMVVLILVPFGASAARAASGGVDPSGDDALIGLRAHDVFTSERPWVGQPSTSHLYGPEEGTSHPGPIEFYWLATPLRLLGPSVGMIVGSLAFNLASVLVAAWVVLRPPAPSVAGWAMVLLSLLLWSEGTAILSDRLVQTQAASRCSPSPCWRGPWSTATSASCRWVPCSARGSPSSTWRSASPRAPWSSTRWRASPSGSPTAGGETGRPGPTTSPSRGRAG